MNIQLAQRIDGFIRYLIFPIIALAIWGAIHPMNLCVKNNLGFSGATGVLGAMFVLVLLIERATELIIRYRRGQYTDKLTREISVLEKNGLVVPVEESIQHKAFLMRKCDELFFYKQDTRKQAWFFSFSISILLCISGVGILGEIFVIPTDLTNFDQEAFFSQPSLFRFSDIILTSCLLAGGTNFFHNLVNAAEKFSESLRKYTDTKNTDRAASEAIAGLQPTGTR